MSRLIKNKMKRVRKRNIYLGLFLCMFILMGGIGIINRQASKITGQNLSERLLDVRKDEDELKYTFNILGVYGQVDFDNAKKTFERIINELIDKTNYN